MASPSYQAHFLNEFLMISLENDHVASPSSQAHFLNEFLMISLGK